MNAELIYETLVKWLIPFLCAGAFALLVKPLFLKAKKGHETDIEEDWNRRASSLKQTIEECRETDKKLTILIEEVREESRSADKENLVKLQETEERLADEIQKNTSGVREALLTMHLYNLIQDGERYIQKGKISEEEYNDYEARYNIYKKLGGNGHMEIWFPKIKQLPRE